MGGPMLIRLAEGLKNRECDFVKKKKFFKEFLKKGFLRTAP